MIEYVNMVSCVARINEYIAKVCFEIGYKPKATNCRYIWITIMNLAAISYSLKAYVNLSY